MTAKRTVARSAFGTSGRRLWNAVTTQYELDEHEQSLLVQACRTTDLCDDLQRTVEREGLEIQKTQRTRGPHWALAELRQQRIAYARILAALELPAGEEGVVKAPKPRNRKTAYEVAQSKRLKSVT